MTVPPNMVFIDLRDPSGSQLTGCFTPEKAKKMCAFFVDTFTKRNPEPDKPNTPPTTP